MTGTIAKESSWLYDVGRANDFLKAALAGDNSMEDDRLALGLKYKSKTKEWRLKKETSLPVKGHKERVVLYSKRYNNKQDMYTGQPLIDKELNEWYTDRAKAKLGQRLSNYQKQKARK